MSTTDEGAAGEEEELRRLVREFVDAHDAYMRAKTKDNSHRLARLRRRIEELLVAVRPSGRDHPAPGPDGRRWR